MPPSHSLPYLLLFTFTITPGFMLGATVARAAPNEAPKVALAALESAGDLSEAARVMLRQRLIEGLTAARLSVLETIPTACDKPACFRDEARQAGVDFIITARVQESQKNYDFSLELWNGSTGRSSGSLDRRCAICGLTEAGERLSLAASALAERIHAVVSEPPRILVTSSPRGAQVVIDGEQRGFTPVELNLPAGIHRLAVSAPGHHAIERDVTVTPGVDHAVELTLIPQASEFSRGYAGWTALGVGAVLLASGIALMAAHGREVGCSDAEKDADGDCPKLYTTSYLGAGLIGLGAASATLGGMWLSLDRSPGAGPGAPAQLSGGVGLRGTF